LLLSSASRGCPTLTPPRRPWTSLTTIIIITTIATGITGIIIAITTTGIAGKNETVYLKSAPFSASGADVFFAGRRRSGQACR
jgi:hypothetical protein